MINTIRIAGFKSLEMVTIEVKPITVLIGLNSSGKSSVLQFLQILKQSAKESLSSLKSDGSLVNLGNFNDIVLKKKDATISFLLTGTREQYLKEPFSQQTSYSYFVTVDHKGIQYSDCTISSGNFKLKGKFEREATGSTPISGVIGESGRLSFLATDIVGLPFSLSGMSGDISKRNDEQLRQFLGVIRFDLTDFFMVPAMRGMSLPNTYLDAQASDELVDARNLDSQQVKLASTVVYDSPALERKINKWISKVTGIAVRARTVPDKRASIEVFRKLSVNIVNEGFGSNQLIHLFAQIAKAPSCSTIGIEEPETHLHPKAQSELAKVLIELSEEEGKNLILTTHSEHILYRILIEVAQGKLSLEDLAIYHFRLTEEGTTEVEKVAVDEKGKLSKGLPDFFDLDLEEFKDLLQSLKA